MARGWRPCPKPHCPEPTPPGQRYCDEHLAAYELGRGSKAERGYGRNFQAERRQLANQLKIGPLKCWRCLKPINPGQAFDLGHDDNDRSIIRGPEHQSCNRSAAGKSAHH